MKTISKAELKDLLFAYCHGTATAEEMARLQKLVVADPHVQDAYVRYVALHSRLHASTPGPKKIGNDCPKRLLSNFFLVHHPTIGKSAHTFRLGYCDFIIGRSKWLDISLLDGSISRKHAMISVDSTGVVVRDLGSRNGTFINEVQINEASRAFPGDCIRLGQIEFTLTRDLNGDQGIDPSCDTLDIRSNVSPPTVPNLSPAAHRVFLCLSQGMTEKEIAETLNRSPATIHNHVKSIYEAFSVKSRAEFLLKILHLDSK